MRADIWLESARSRQGHECATVAPRRRLPCYTTRRSGAAGGPWGPCSAAAPVSAAERAAGTTQLSHSQRRGLKPRNSLPDSTQGLSTLSTTATHNLHQTYLLRKTLDLKCLIRERSIARLKRNYLHNNGATKFDFVLNLSISHVATKY